ncbi:TlpA family protein disulfide reductase [Wolinella succinogenes]|uniref:Alkyl hydroperoxide reductase subunit C/ Thiol specific antioxidant domain-containing protein n=1 Tax=Wolinella succinogenes (strain ATCC 29543 / DSM 1740 / CCUG 13145 / JCM 31913 / LMG 7466 / NCTC 11488 / FDC 602W) TaxID=273121 RepID=Q7MR95_WOLSU|nr:TlpA disulfide reductase family protein [Wolinella succinogenes]CAE10600.1 hypothetical protein WS1557 [Wolinella succinogenes]VEG80744.1 Thiol-disulfide oxidoreductase ykuV [Wolinella succinogenes]HCZ18724.1 TlpA family protein disulfide reductase [Helicobacter sp.]
MRIFALALVMMLWLGGCKEELGEKHHMVLNRDQGITTRFSPQQKRLQLSSPKPYLLFFFTASCGACKEAIPYLNAIEEQWGERFEVIGVLGGSRGIKSDLEFLKRHSIRFKVLSDPSSSDYLSRAVGGVMGVPLFFFFDETGAPKEHFLGLVPQRVLEEEVRSLL